MRSERDFRRLNCPCIGLSCLVLTQCCVLTWVTNILIGAILNDHVDRIWPVCWRLTQPTTCSS